MKRVSFSVNFKYSKIFRLTESCRPENVETLTFEINLYHPEKAPWCLSEEEFRNNAKADIPKPAYSCEASGKDMSQGEEEIPMCDGLLRRVACGYLLFFDLPYSL